MGENWHYFVCLSANVVCFAIILCVLPADPVCLPGMNIGPIGFLTIRRVALLGYLFLRTLGNCSLCCAKMAELGRKWSFPKCIR